MRIRKGDMVQVIAGDDKGRVGKVLRVLRDSNRVVVEGMNRVYKHIRPTQRNPSGGRLSKEMPINVSNVMLYNADLGRGVRVGVKTNEAGERVRVCRASGAELGVLRKVKSEGAASE